MNIFLCSHIGQFRGQRGGEIRKCCMLFLHSGMFLWGRDGMQVLVSIFGKPFLGCINNDLRVRSRIFQTQSLKRYDFVIRLIPIYPPLSRTFSTCGFILRVLVFHLSGFCSGLLLISFHKRVGFPFPRRDLFPKAIPTFQVASLNRCARKGAARRPPRRKIGLLCDMTTRLAFPGGRVTVRCKHLFCNQRVPSFFFMRARHALGID